MADDATVDGPHDHRVLPEELGHRDETERHEELLRQLEHAQCVVALETQHKRRRCWHCVFDKYTYSTVVTYEYSYVCDVDYKIDICSFGIRLAHVPGSASRR